MKDSRRVALMCRSEISCWFNYKFKELRILRSVPDCYSPEDVDTL